MTKLNRISSLFFILTMLAGCQQDRADHTADISSPGESSSPTNATLFVGGDVVTVDENYPNAEAVAVGEGKILAVGKTLEVQEFLAEAGYTADIRDLDGMTLAPGFIDAHGHISFVASTISAVDLQPSPAGNTDSIETMLSKLDEWHQNNPGKWVEGWGYDDSLLVENRHPTRADLDKVSTDVPIVLRHVSGHLAAANSKMLEIAGISAESEDPPGGHIQRMPGTNEPNGVLEESAWFAVTAMLPKPSKDEELEHLIAAQEYYASRGITTVQDGAALEPEIPVYREAAAQGKLYLDIVSFPAFFGPMRMGENFDFSQTYSDHFRIGGMKLFLDGSPQGKTAWLSHPYHIPPEGKGADYRGYPTSTDEALAEHFAAAYERGVPVLAHTNGDAAAEQLINAVTAANDKYGQEDRRTVMIHAQTVRDDQLDRMKLEGMVPSFFVAHTFFWGDWHRDSVLGPERAARISPLKSALDRDIVFTTHTDTPVVPANFLHLMWTAVNRETRSGETLGADQRVSALDALKSVTINAAWQYFEEESKGSITPGKRADMVILSDNPLKVDPSAIKAIQVVETIKDGETVYRRAE